MPHHIFFSWQSDIAPLVCRNFVQRALEVAIAEVAKDTSIDLADRELAIDRDSSGVPGSPPIVETIFGKIDRAAAFVSDLTYVASRADGRRMPNPNVLLEHGWALNALSWRGVISVMNTAYGHPDEHALPFDLQHFRRPIFFDCHEKATEEDRLKARAALARQLATALKAILADDVLRADRDEGGGTGPHPHDVDLLDQVRRQLPTILQRFLHRHNFGSPFRRDMLDQLHEMNEDWVGAAYEFHDAVLQGAFADLRRLADELGELVLRHTYPINNSPVMAWHKTDMDVALGTQASTVKAVTAMNTKAQELSSAIDRFERTARDRIRIAAAGPPGPDPRCKKAEGLLAEMAQDQLRGRVPGIVSLPKMTLRLVPLAATEGKRLDPQALAKAQLRFPPDSDVRVKSDADGYQWWSFDPPRDVGSANRESAWRTRLARPGIVEYQAVVGQREDDDRTILVDGRELERSIVEGLVRLERIVAEIDMAGPALVSIVFDGMEDVELTRARGGGRPIGRPHVTLPTVLADGAGPVSDELHEPFDILWQSSGWADGSPSFGTGKWTTDAR